MFSVMMKVSCGFFRYKIGSILLGLYRKHLINVHPECETNEAVQHSSICMSNPAGCKSDVDNNDECIDVNPVDTKSENALE